MELVYRAVVGSAHRAVVALRYFVHGVWVECVGECVHCFVPVSEVVVVALVDAVQVALERM